MAMTAFDESWTESSFCDEDALELQHFLQYPISLLEEQLLNIPEFDMTPFDTTSILEPSKSPIHQIRYHDCMWSGRCVEHQDKSKCPSSFVNCNSDSKISATQQQQQLVKNHICPNGTSSKNNGQNSILISKAATSSTITPSPTTTTTLAAAAATPAPATPETVTSATVTPTPATVQQQTNNANILNKTNIISSKNNIISNSNKNTIVTSSKIVIKSQKQQHQQQPPHSQFQHQQQHRLMSAFPSSMLSAAPLSAVAQRDVNNSSQHIPAGASLLINSRLNQQKRQQQQQKQLQQQPQQQPQQLWLKQQQCKMKLSNLVTFDSLKDDDQPSLLVRPDTPLSLDDEAPEFKHTIDLAACTTGSNRQCLDNITMGKSTKYINFLKNDCDDVDMNFIGAMGMGNGRSIRSRSSSLAARTFCGLQNDDDDDYDIDSAIEADSDNESGNNTSVCSNEINYSGDQYDDDHPAITLHSDHSYTRCKNRVDLNGLGVQTPSDSEEEIDVVSVGDKALPTNPSAKDKRALQNTVAHKISARIVKTPKGIKTIPPRRRSSEESCISNITSPNKSPTVTSDYYSSSSLSGSNAVICGGNILSGASTKYSHNSRKRHYASTVGENSATATPNCSMLSSPTSSPTKRYRGKKQRSPCKRQASDSEADTIEKRNLHNDMERQRRIGLKNLFEELKRQIPSIKDKERAPKVSILREASVLCHKLSKEHDQVIALRAQQERLRAHLKSLRTTLAQKRGTCIPE